MLAWFVGPDVWLEDPAPVKLGSAESTDTLQGLPHTVPLLEPLMLSKAKSTTGVYIVITGLLSSINVLKLKRKEELRAYFDS